MRRETGVHREKRQMAGGGVRWRNGARGASMCPSYRPAGKNLYFLVFFFLMEYADSPYVHLENN